MLSSDALMAALTAEYERHLEVNHASLVALFTAVDTNADWTINRVGQLSLGSRSHKLQSRPTSVQSLCRTWQTGISD